MRPAFEAGAKRSDRASSSSLRQKASNSSSLENRGAGRESLPRLDGSTPPDESDSDFGAAGSTFFAAIVSSITRLLLFTRTATSPIITAPRRCAAALSR